jgi:nucleotide-binding universal stress UspA family protein
MAFPYRKILCPIDFDENSSKALETAIELARHFKAATKMSRRMSGSWISTACCELRSSRKVKVPRVPFEEITLKIAI